jgi:hypothetical protein
LFEEKYESSSIYIVKLSRLQRYRMNLNHIAKKPFFDLFYRTPCMHVMLRAALYDSLIVEADSKAR